MTQIGVEAATPIPPLAYSAVMMVVIAIPVVVRYWCGRRDRFTRTSRR